MADLKPPSLPFFDDGESIESAAEQMLDHSAQLKFLRKQNAQLAARQEELHRVQLQTNVDVGRGLDRSTVAVGLVELLNRRVMKIMKHWKIPDVEDPTPSDP